MMMISNSISDSSKEQDADGEPPFAPFEKEVSVQLAKMLSKVLCASHSRIGFNS